MSAPRFSTGARRVARGGISWVTLVLVVAVAAGGYLAWVWLPVYFQLYTVKQVVRDYMNQAIKDADDEGLRRKMVLKLRMLGRVESVDAEGHPVVVPAVALEEGQVTWERDESAQPPTLRVVFEYERPVVYPLIGRTEMSVFTVDLTNDLSRPDWGPAR
jgi:hypothetical protein